MLLPVSKKIRVDPPNKSERGRRGRKEEGPQADCESSDSE